MTDPIDRTGGRRPTNEELADTLNEVIEDNNLLSDAISKILVILSDSGIIEEAIEANKAIDKKEIN